MLQTMGPVDYGHQPDNSFVSMYVWKYVCLYVCKYARMHVCICLYVYMYVCRARGWLSSPLLR